MKERLFWLLIFTGVLVLLDIYVFQAVKTVTQSQSSTARKTWYTIYWSLAGLTLLGIILLVFIGFENVSSNTRNFFMTWVIGTFLAKLFVAIFLFMDDLQRLTRWIMHSFSAEKSSNDNGYSLPRAKFLSKAGLLAGTLPIITFTYGIAKGAYDYKIRRQRIGLKNLPASFEGLKIAQISDIHAGSFFDKDKVKRGIRMLLEQKPDVVFFTGDLVNNIASEMDDYIEVFEKIKAPMGVYSTLGNHDYGDYIPWSSKEEKDKNLQTLINIHKQMGWDILINENRVLEKNGEKIAILGVENWSAKGRFPKYGRIDKAYEGTSHLPVKLLLSHDPSHWRAEILENYKDIDVMFAGHTHGFQFGLEVGKIKWSPVQWVYKEWAGLYKENSQFLYVNRGFGFIGLPGRIGINPEITIVELFKS